MQPMLRMPEICSSGFEIEKLVDQAEQTGQISDQDLTKLVDSVLEHPIDLNRVDGLKEKLISIANKEPPEEKHGRCYQITMLVLNAFRSPPPTPVPLGARPEFQQMVKNYESFNKIEHKDTYDLFQRGVSFILNREFLRPGIIATDHFTIPLVNTLQPLFDYNREFPIILSGRQRNLIKELLSIDEDRYHGLEKVIRWLGKQLNELDNQQLPTNPQEKATAFLDYRGRIRDGITQFEKIIDAIYEEDSEGKRRDERLCVDATITELKRVDEENCRNFMGAYSSTYQTTQQIGHEPIEIQDPAARERGLIPQTLIWDPSTSQFSARVQINWEVLGDDGNYHLKPETRTIKLPIMIAPPKYDDDIRSAKWMNASNYVGIGWPESEEVKLENAEPIYNNEQNSFRWEVLNQMIEALLDQRGNAEWK